MNISLSLIQEAVLDPAQIILFTLASMGALLLLLVSRLFGETKLVRSRFHQRDSVEPPHVHL